MTLPILLENVEEYVLILSSIRLREAVVVRWITTIRGSIQTQQNELFPFPRSDRRNMCVGSMCFDREAICSQVAPAELEALLLRHPGVADCGVVGLPDEAAGELPVAFVVPQPNANLTADAIIKYVASKVSCVVIFF